MGICKIGKSDGCVIPNGINHVIAFCKRHYARLNVMEMDPRESEQKGPRILRDFLYPLAEIFDFFHCISEK